MKKILLLSLVLLVACHQVKKPDVVTSPATTATQTPVATSTVGSASEVIVIPEGCVVFDNGKCIEFKKPFLTVSGCSNCKADEWARVQAAVVKTNEVVLTKCFRDGMEARKLIQTNGLTNAQVVDALINGNVTIETEMYWTAKRVLGYTLPTAKKEWLNRRYMMEWNVCDLASLLGHETAHKVGFAHDYNRTARRIYSVPYSINAVFKNCCIK